MLDLQPEHVRQTRAQIESFVAQIAAAGKTFTNQQAFLNVALDRLQQAMGASSVGLWQRDLSVSNFEKPTWRSIASRDLPETLCNNFDALNEDADANKTIEEQLDAAEAMLQQAGSDNPTAVSTQPAASLSLNRLLDCVDRDATAVLVPPSTVAIEGNRPSNPTNQSLIFAPIQDEVNGGNWWLQVLQNPTGGPATHRGYLRFVVQISELITDFLKHAQLRNLQQQEHLFTAANKLLSDLSASKRDVASSLSADALIARAVVKTVKADEAFLITKSKRRSKPHLGQRAGGLQLVSHSTAAARLHQDICTTVQAQPQRATVHLQAIEKSDSQTLSLGCNDLFGSQAVGILPICVEAQTQHRKAAYVVMVVLWYRLPDHCNAETLSHQLDSVAGMTSLATRWIDDAVIQETLAQVEQPQNLKWLPRYLICNSKVRVAILLSCLIAACCIPVPMYLSANAQLIPISQQAIYAPLDGIVSDVIVQYGQRVKVGQVLLRMRNDTLQNEHQTAVAEKVENQQKQQDIQLQLLRSKDLTAVQRDALEGELSSAAAISQHQTQRIALLEQQLDRLNIRANIDGVVGTWKVATTLHQRPVMAGQALMDVFDPAAAWELEVALPESDIGCYQKTLAQSQEHQFDVRLDSDPTRWIKVNYQRMNESFVLHRSAANKAVAPFRIPVNREQFEQLSPGASAVVRMPIGSRPVAWVLTRDFVLSLWSKVRLWM